MPLYEEFKYRLPVRLGPAQSPLARQVAEQGLTLPDADLWEQRHRAWCLLFIGGFLTDAEAERIGHRIITRVGTAACFEQELNDSVLQVLATLEQQRTQASAHIANTLDEAPDAPKTPTVEEPDSRPPLSLAPTDPPPSALDDYLANRAAS